MAVSLKQLYNELQHLNRLNGFTNSTGHYNLKSGTGGYKLVFDWKRGQTSMVSPSYTTKKNIQAQLHVMVIAVVSYGDRKSMRID